MKAVVKSSGNSNYQVDDEVEVKHVYKKFYSQTFGTYFLIQGVNERGETVDLKCKERRCDILHGGEWVLDYEDEKNYNKEQRQISLDKLEKDLINHLISISSSKTNILEKL